MIYLVVAPALCFLLLLVECSLVTVSANLCPVSMEVHRDPSTEYVYPLGVYYAANSRMSTVACADVDANLRANHFKCPSVANGCPVRDYGSAVTDSANSWNKSANICRLRKLLKESNESVRVFVIGSSVPIGMLANGCCSREECSVKVENPKSYCSWFRQFAVWMNAAHPAKVTWFNWAKSGFTSHMSMLNVNLPRDGVTSFTSRDLIFLDHYHTDVVRLNQVAADVGLDGLVRKVLLHSASTTETPTVILMDTSSRTHNRSEGVMSTYHKVAAHYGLRLYSFYDAVHSLPPSSNDPQYEKLYQQLTLDPVFRADHHPPWHVHLYMADLFATTLYREFNQCTDDEPVVVPYVIPQPLVPVNRTTSCVSERLLSISYDNLMNTNLSSTGKYRSDPNVWQVRTDRKGRGGFINELSTNTTCDALQKPLVFDWGWNISLASQFNLMLQVVFQRSYWNAGKVGVHYCGRLVAELDALWTDHETFHYTLPQVAVGILRGGWCHHSGIARTAPAVLSFVQEPQGCDPGAQPRQKQQIRILSVEVCQADSDDDLPPAVLSRKYLPGQEPAPVTRVAHAAPRAPPRLQTRQVVAPKVAKRPH